MARTIGSVRMYSPYVFLASEDGNSEYKVFIAIPHEAGKKVSYNNDLNYLNGSTELSFEIVSDNSVASAGKYYKGIPLSPGAAAAKEGYTFNASTFSVKVNVYRISNVGGQQITLTQTTKVFYSDADPNAAVSGDKSADCPYVYLTNPNAVGGGSSDEYTPCCLVPLQSYEEDTQNYTETIDNVQGNCQQEINMKSLTTPGKTEINPDNITANTETYDDPGVKQGYFEVVLNYPVPQGQQPGTIHKRKIKVKNASSDPNPSSFIDNF